MKVTTDGSLFGAWIAEQLRNSIAGTCKLLDIGTGTGLLSMMLSQENNIIVDAVEIDKDAFEQAKENVAASRWNDSIHVIHADVMNFESGNKYDAMTRRISLRSRNGLSCSTRASAVS